MEKGDRRNHDLAQEMNPFQIFIQTQKNDRGEII
jgi:hypothetical protein